MKISTEINSTARVLSEEKAVELVAKAGFDGWDLSMFRMANYNWGENRLEYNDHPLAGPDYLKFVRNLKQIGLDNGIVCNQSHAPFPSCCKQIRDLYKRSIECTAEAGGSICVIHPHNDLSPEENAVMYLELMPFAKEHAVKIATENMWNWDGETDRSCFAACATSESFVAHVDAVNDPWMVACLDIGHAEMVGSGSGAPEMIRALGSRLQALHIHDNDRWHDNHQIPFSMDVDFDAIVKALKDIGYSGWFTLESEGYMKKFSDDSMLQGLKDMAAAAKRLADMFEA